MSVNDVGRGSSEDFWYIISDCRFLRCKVLLIFKYIELVSEEVEDFCCFFWCNSGDLVVYVIFSGVRRDKFGKWCV